MRWNYCRLAYFLTDKTDNKEEEWKYVTTTYVGNLTSHQYTRKQWNFCKIRISMTLATQCSMSSMHKSITYEGHANNLPRTPPPIFKHFVNLHLSHQSTIQDIFVSKVDHACGNHYINVNLQGIRHARGGHLFLVSLDNMLVLTSYEKGVCSFLSKQIVLFLWPKGSCSSPWHPFTFGHSLLVCILAF